MKHINRRNNLPTKFWAGKKLRKKKRLKVNGKKRHCHWKFKKLEKKIFNGKKDIYIGKTKHW